MLIKSITHLAVSASTSCFNRVSSRLALLKTCSFNGSSINAFLLNKSQN